MRKRMISMLLVVLLGASLGYGGQQKNITNTKEIKQFTAFFTSVGATLDVDNEMRQIIGEKIGAVCEETWLTGQTRDSAWHSFIASGEYPDFISGDVTLYERGALIPLDEYWDEYPYIKEYLTTEQWDRFRQEDGHIYWIPQFGVSGGESVETFHQGEAFWIQTRVLKWAGYPEITTVEEYFDLIERYIEANPQMEDGTANIPFTVLCDDWRYFCLENVPQFLDGYPNDGCAIVNPDTLEVIDYNTTDTAKAYFKKLNEEYHKGIFDSEAFTSTYQQYIEKIATGAVLGMVDQWWQFYYQTNSHFESYGLEDQGCNYVPLPITMEEGVENYWNVDRTAELSNASGLSITTSCSSVEDAMQFLNDLMSPEIVILRYWGCEGTDYSVDENGQFYLTDEQRARYTDKKLTNKYFCPYSYFPRTEGILPDGINAFSPEYQPYEFMLGQPEDVQECLKAYDCENYVDMLGTHESPGKWYPLYSYLDTISDESELGAIRIKIDDVKHTWLPQVIMAEDFETTWSLYMEDYAACEPEILRQAFQEEVERRVNN